MGKFTEPFLDCAFFQHVDNTLKHTIATPKFEKQVFKEGETDYEGKYSEYFNIIQEGTDIKVYYRGMPKEFTIMAHTGYNSWLRQYTCLLKSNDGLNFTRPIINNVKYNNDTKNNILFKGYESHAFCCFIDPKKIGGTKYKGVTRRRLSKESRKNCNMVLSLYESNDGIEWKECKIIIENKHSLKDYHGYANFDCLSNIVYDKCKDQYILYTRHNARRGLRLIQMSTSKDLLNWSKCREIKFNDKYNVYSPNIISYPNSPYFMGFPVYQKENHRNTKYVSLMFSRDGVNWKNIINKKQFITDIKIPGSIFRGIVELNDKFYFYTKGYYTFELLIYSCLKNRIGYFEGTGELISKDIKLLSNEIEINYKTEENGSVEVQLFNKDKFVSKSEILKGNELNKIVKLQQYKENNEYNLKFILINACVYSINIDYEL